jgi:transcriptional regulator with XRE-family HTH domain
MIFCELLRKKRESAGLSRAELALYSGLSLETIDSLETGETTTITFDTCYKLGAALTGRSDQAFILHDLWCAARSSSARARRQSVSCR